MAAKAIVFDRSRRQQLIAVRCEESPGPGVSWQIEVEFRPEKSGFSVWTYEDGVAQDFPVWREIGLYEEPLTWRAACRFLAKRRSLRAYGDLWSAVKTEGMPWFGAAVASCLFIQDQEAPWDWYSIGRLLLGFADPELREVLTEAPIPPTGEEGDECPGLASIQIMAALAKPLGLRGKTLAELKAAMALPPAATLDRVAEAFTRAGVKERVNDLTSQSTRAEGFPSAEVQAKTSSAWQDLSAGPLPESPDLRIKLVQKWLSEPDKPTGGGPRMGTGQPGSPWPILRWLVGSTKEAVLTFGALQKHDPDLARSFVNEVMKRGKAISRSFEQPFPYSGWAINVIGKPLMRGQVMTALQVQEVADRLGIPIDESFRIGLLAYLDR